MKNIKSIEQFLFESKATAKKRFLDRGLISDEVFERFLEVDITPTKRFIEKMCEFFVAGSSEGEVITTFQKVTQSKIKFDISTIKSLSELSDILSREGLTANRNKLQLSANEKGVEITYEDDRFTVLYITTKEASKKYGSGTTWCISAEKKNQWDNYKKNGSDFYFIYDYKTTNKAWKKLAVEVKYIGDVKVYNTFDNAKDYIGWEDDIIEVDYLINNIKNVEVAFKYDKELFDKDVIFKKLYGIRGEFSINSDGEVDVDGDVYINYKGITKIPIRFGKVTGNFEFSNNLLTSLEGCPDWVGGYFSCSRNNLTSLEFAPSYVGRFFDCCFNNLTSLKGSPIEVVGDFRCYNNNLTSLEGAPSEVRGNFSCYNNNLTSLEFAPSKVGGSFNCSENNLTSLEFAPSEVGGSFYCSNNNLTSLEGVPSYVSGYFSCSFNNLTSLEFAPSKVGSGFYCNHNHLTSLEFSPSEVGESFDCSNQKNGHKFTKDEVVSYSKVKELIYV